MATTDDVQRVMRLCHAHVKEHWGEPLSHDISALKTAWYEKFGELNEEREDSVSVTDLLYVIFCYSVVIANAHAPVSLRPTLEDALEVLTQLKLLGSQSSAQTRFLWPTAEEWFELQFRTAWLVVFCFSKRKEELLAGVGPCTAASLSAPLQARVREARCIDFPIVRDKADKPAASDAQKPEQPQQPASEAQPGGWWLSGPEALVANFIAFSGRVMQKINFDNDLMSSIPLRPLDVGFRERVCDGSNRLRLKQWLQRRCSIQSTNDFYLTFRDNCFESALPLNSAQGLETRMSSKRGKIQTASSSLDTECGFCVLHRVHMRSDEEVVKIAADEKHEYHSNLLLVMFGFILHHMHRVKFSGVHYFGNQDSHKFKKGETTKWGMNMRPCILQLCKRLVVVDVSGPDRDSRSATKQWELIECADMYEALLYWLFLMQTKYNNELICSTRIDRFVKSIEDEHKPTQETQTTQAPQKATAAQ
jgi:hypothetical protein